MVMVSFTAVVCPRKLAVSPETQGDSVVPLLLQKLSVPHVPLPDWKPADVEVSHVTVAPIAGVRAKAAARRKDGRTRDGVVRIEVGLCVSTNACTANPGNYELRKRVNNPTTL
jgi:hypothetical protein